MTDFIPLGVTGAVSVPLGSWPEGIAPGPDHILRTDDERRDYVTSRILESLNRPLTAPGSERLAQAWLARSAETERASMFARFSEKVLATLRDGERHDTLAVDPDAGTASWFVAWSGSHREVQPWRVGEYLDRLASTARRVVDMGVPITGFLEIDAYVREHVDPADPARPLADSFAIDVEYSFLPGPLFGGDDVAEPVFGVVLVNAGLCTTEERQSLASFMT